MPGPMSAPNGKFQLTFNSELRDRESRVRGFSGKTDVKNGAQRKATVDKQRRLAKERAHARQAERDDDN